MLRLASAIPLITSVDSAELLLLALGRAWEAGSDSADPGPLEPAGINMRADGAKVPKAKILPEEEELLAGVLDGVGAETTR